MRRLLSFLVLTAWCALTQAQILPGILAGGFNAGGGGTSIALDATSGQKTANTGAGTGTSVNLSLSTAGAGELVVCGSGIGSGGGAVASQTVSGSTLGTFTNPTGATVGIWTNQLWSKIWFLWASSQLTSETITFTVTTASQNLQLTCAAYTGAKNPTALTPGTDYASTAGSSTSVESSALTVTTKAANSWLTCQSSWWATTVSPSANPNTTIDATYANNSGQPAFTQMHRTDQPLAIGSYAVGATPTGSNGHTTACMEILVGP